MKVRVPIAVVSAIVFISRVLTVPRTFWMGEELRFARALLTFDPLQQQPEPPGYPLYVATGRLLNFFVRDPFVTLVALSVIASAIGAYLVGLVVADMFGDDWTGAAASLVFYFSPAMLAFDALPNPESVTIALLAAAFLALVHERPIWFGVAAAAAVAVRPEIAFAVAILVLFRPRALPAFIAVVVIAFIPLVAAIGVSNIAPYAKANYGVMRTASAAIGLHGRELMLRFIAHPWGSKWMSFPLLLVVVAGFVHRGSTALKAFVIAHLAFCFAFADRANGVRPVMPVLIAIAIFAITSLAAWPRVACTLAAIYAIGGVAYTWPLLSERMTPSPPARAIRFTRRFVPREATLLYEPSMEAWANVSRIATAPVRDFDQFVDKPTPLFLLADGGSRMPHAAHFEWPDSDAYGKITTDRYRVVSVIPFPPPSRYRSLGGIYAFERTVDGREWRWLGNDVALELPHLGLRVVQVTLALPTDAPIEANTVTVNATTINVARGQQVTIAVPVTPVLRIHSARTFSSARDARSLAVQLIAIQQR